MAKSSLTEGDPLWYLQKYIFNCGLMSLTLEHIVSCYLFIYNI